MTAAPEMLCLALAAYGGFTERDPRAVRGAVLDMLSRFAPAWQLTWGPAGHRAPLAVLDESAVFLARDGDRLAVAIRGTNPLSPLDWLFGDFWVNRLLPWPDAPDAAISASSAIGLEVVRHLRSGPDRAARRRTGRRWSWLRPLEQFLGQTADAIDDRVRQQQLAYQRWRDALAEGSPLDRLNTLVETRAASARTEAIDAAFRAVDAVARDALLERLLSQARALADEPGEPLTAALRAAVDDGAREVHVTGHSKGGALASVVALWLADARDDWDPDGRAALHGWTFAAPTPGNAAFAARAEASFPIERIANPLDVVTRAWVPAEIAGVDGLYGDAIPQPAVLAPLTARIIEEVAPMDYAHPGTHRPLAPRLADEPSWWKQLIHQYLQRYLDALDLAGTLHARDVFGPLV